MKTPASLLLLPLMALAASAHAEIYCVGDGTILQLALHASAQSPTVNDSIRLEAGTYHTTSPDGFYAAFGNDNTGNLDISGGWSSGCQVRLPGRRSTIDGELTRPGMRLYGTLGVHGRVRITNLEFVRGRATGQHISGGLTVDRGYDIEIESNVFSDNALENANTVAGAGLYAVSEGAISVRNNLFVRNDADSPASPAAGGAAVYCYGSGGVGRFINNTVYDNTADAGASSDVGGVYVGGLAACGWDVANNSLWGNPGLDLSLGSVSVSMRNNDLQNRGGSETPSASSGNFSASPQFLSATDFRLKRSSPLVDAGLDAAGGGVTGGSLDGGPRLVGPHVDIGAYELDRLFADGFDPPST
jgi:hypothetical protein